MAITNLSELTAAQKEEVVASLAALMVGSSASDEGITADKLVAVAESAGCSLSAGTAKLFTLVCTTAPDGIGSFTSGPGGGGGGGGGGGDGGDAAEAKEEEKEVEEEMDMGGGMDMFGGDEAEGGGGDY
jgi:ribosomal protein L12E/L44/L45/RPP1/RPP2